MKPPIVIYPSFAVDVQDVVRALREAGMRVTFDDRILIAHKPARDLAAELAEIDLSLPALLRPQCGPTS